MVNNQKEFNERYSHAEQEIKIRYKKFQGRLVIENYSKLERLQLLKVNSIDKIILKNLTQLQGCTIQGCSVVELVIENCPQIKTLNVRNNSLTNLEFLANLENLEELEINGNDELVEILEPYQGDWKNYKKDKDIQEIFELIKQGNLREIVKKCLDLKKSREDLKIKVDKLIKKTQQPTISQPINTKELILNLGKEFEEKEARIYYLESRTQELIDLSKNQKEKIINAYLTHLGSKKESVAKLIKTHIEFIKFEKQEIDSPNYGEKYREYENNLQDIKNQLWTSLSKEAMNGVQRILTDCKKLVEQELELETKLDDSKSLLIEGKEHLSQVPSDNREETNRQLKTRLDKTEERIKEQPITQQIINYVYNIASVNQLATGDNTTFSNYHQYNLYYQQLANETEKEIIEPLTNLKVTEQDKQVINQTIIFWGTQELFLNYRQNTINKLVNCYCRLANKTKVTKKWTTRINSVMGITSKLAKSIPNGGVAETPLGIVGDIAVLTDIILEDKYLDKCIKEFKEIISKDSKDLIFFDQSYDSLYKTIWNNNQLLSPVTTKITEVLDLIKEKPYPFSEGQNIYKASGIRQEYFASLNSEQLKSFLEKLDNNLVELCQSFENQKKQLTEQEWFKVIDQQTDLLQEQQIQAQVEIPPK